jgi:hypothetical protein
MQLDGRQGPLCLRAGWQNHLGAGRINSLGMSHCPMGTVPLLYRVIQAVSRLAKTPKRRSLVSSAERVAPAIPLSHIPFRCFAISQGDLLLSRGWGFSKLVTLKEAGDRSLRGYRIVRFRGYDIV